MAKNEAKIKFTAETGQFNDAIKKSNDEMSELRAEFKLNEAQMKSTGTSIEGLKKKHSLLENQLKASQSKTEALSAKVDKAAEIFGENSAEVTKLKTQLANAQTAEEKIKQAIDKCNSELAEQIRKEKEAESATKNLTDTIDDQRSEVDRLKNEYAEAVLKYGSTSKEAKALGKEIKDLSTELKENEDKLESATKDADKFDKSLDEAGDSAVGMSDKLGTAAVGVAAFGAAMVAAGKEAIDAFNEVDDGADNVIKATGATGEAAAELEESYKKVASSIVGDFSDIGSTLGEVNTRFGFTGSEAEEATTQFLKFAEVTGMDAVSAVQDVSRAIESAGLDTSEYGNILDALTKAGQQTGVSVDTLASSLTDNGAVMREMGYDINTTIAMLAQFEKAGVDSNSVVRGMRTAIAKWSKDGLDAKTEFSKLVQGIKDGSVSAGEAYEVFGSKAGGELVDAIKSGRFEYEDMLSVIEGSKGSLDNTFDATVDGGYELELAMQNAKMALAEAGGELGTALIPAFQFFSGNILPAATKAIGAMVTGISAAVGWMKEHKGVVVAVATVIGILTTAIVAYNVVQGIKTAMDAAQVTTIWGLVAAHWAQATAAMAALAPYILIVAAIAAVIAIVIVCIKYWDEISAAVVSAAQASWNAIKVAWDWIVNAVKVGVMFIGSIISAAWNIITLPFRFIWENCKNTVISIFNTIKNAVSNALSAIGAWFANLWAKIKTIFAPIANWFSEKFNAAKQGVQNAWSSVTNFFSNIWSGIKSAFSAVGSWFSNTFNKAKEAIVKPIEAAKAKVKSIVDAIKGFFNNLKLKLPNIKLPHFKIEGSFSLNPPSVPKLKIDWYSKAMTNPMILNSATIFGHANGKLLGGGEVGSEMIGGTNTVMQMIQSAVDKSMQAMNLSALATAIEDLANRPIELDINGRQFALATAGDSDRVNGLRNRIAERGVLLD